MEETEMSRESYPISQQKIKPMGRITELKKDMIVSIFNEPGTLEDIQERKVMSITDKRGTIMLLSIAERDGYIYKEDDIYKCHKLVSRLKEFIGYKFNK